MKAFCLFGALLIKTSKPLLIQSILPQVSALLHPEHDLYEIFGQSIVFFNCPIHPPQAFKLRQQAPEIRIETELMAGRKPYADSPG
ncbi:hypothetical protein SDC9_163960 [bioreactor metagenome]|uniref:Uncharacterized protein n=1 Tax=bioreactor metagenome TaxID=1076179 RepID=A0A645FQB2_9ZZZZ